MIYILGAVCIVAFIGLGVLFCNLLLGGWDGPTSIEKAIGIVGITLMLAFVLWGISILEGQSIMKCVERSGKLCLVWVRG